MMMTFEMACETVLDTLEADWRSASDQERMGRLEKEKKVILGFEEEMNEYKAKISRIVEEKGLSDVPCPEWYRNISEGIFHELYGLAGLAPWAYDETDEYARSSSAKLIGDRLFCLIDGVSVLQPQRIDTERREQLKRTFLMSAPKERLEQGFHEVYLRNGIRITIYSGERTKPDQDVMVFRKYLLDRLTFEELEDLGTIPGGSAELMKLFVYTGMNVLFAGPVRSGKTTFLRIWQSYEDPKLEGAAVATDPETDWYSIMPEAPVMQLVADGPKLEGIIRPLMRGDNDYIILEEMRDAEAFRTALEIASVSTGRCKATVHTNDASVLPFMMAEKIRQRYGGNTEDIERRIAESFDLAFEMRQTEDNRAEKKLTAITQYYTDPETGVPVFSKLMEYDNRTGKWYWNRRLSPKIIRKLSAFPREMRRILEILKELEEGRR